MPAPPPAVVLLSGGIDSATTLALAAHEGFACHALTVDYGQRHRVELEAARAVAAAVGVVEHRVVRVDLAALGGSALTDERLAVPKGEDPLAPAIPITYVPARNTVLLACALAWSEVLGSGEIFIGANAVDYSGYPDCRPAFLAAFQTLANLATREAVEGRLAVQIHAPVLHLSKADVVRRALSLGLDLGLTHSCYDPDIRGRACGACDACQIRRRAFAEVGVADPTRYVTGG